MDVTQIIGLVDGFLTLVVLIYFSYLHRKDITDLKKELVTAQQNHIADIKASKDEYASLQEKTLIALNNSQDLTREVLVGMEDRIKTHVDNALTK